MQNYLIISAIGHDKPGIVQKISKIVLDNGCSIEDSRMMVLGGEFSVIMMTSGNWNHIAKLENAVKAAASELDLMVTLTRTEPRELKPTLMPYAVEVVAIDNQASCITPPTFSLDAKSISKISIPTPITQRIPAPPCSQ